jgi:beta-lactamase class A
MIELFRQADKKHLRLDDTLVVANQFKSIVDGSPYALADGSDSDDDMYKAIGQPMTLGDLCEHMITKSSNLAANILIERLGPKNIQSTANHLGGSSMHVLRGVEDQKAFDQGLNNTTDATALLNLLTKIGRGDAVSRAASAGMVEILKRQTFNDGIPSGLPAGTAVAHKTGTITGIHHDAAIVFAPRPYVLVVLVRGIRDQKISAQLMGDIARVVDGLAR